MGRGTGGVLLFFQHYGGPLVVVVGGSRCSECPLLFRGAPPPLAAPCLGVPNGSPDVEDKLIWEGEVSEL